MIFHDTDDIMVLSRTLPEHIPGKIHSYSSSTGISFIAMSERSAPDDGSDREPAKGGRGGISGHELFLVIAVVFLLALSGASLYFELDYSGLGNIIGQYLNLCATQTVFNFEENRVNRFVDEFKATNAILYNV
nr:unnamed protein product [Haemonchus contortus]